jgi:hypothetical protein
MAANKATVAAPVSTPPAAYSATKTALPETTALALTTAEAEAWRGKPSPRRRVLLDMLGYN